jgi:hypothetical protein
MMDRENGVSFFFLGCWLFEARSESFIIGGEMQFIVQVAEQIHLPPVPPDFPRCGTHKGLNFII